MQKTNHTHKDCPDMYKPFPTRLRSLMAEQRITRQALAQTLGISRQAVSNYMDGISSPSWENLALMAQTLGVTSDYLLGLSDYRTIETQAVTLSDVGFSDNAIKTLSEAELYHPGAIQGLNLLLVQPDALEIFTPLVCIANISTDVVNQIESGDNDLHTAFSPPEYNKETKMMSLNVDNYLSFAVIEACNLFRHWASIQTGANRLHELLAHKQSCLKDDLNDHTREEDENGIDAQENN